MMSSAHPQTAAVAGISSATVAWIWTALYTVVTAAVVVPTTDKGLVSQAVAVEVPQRHALPVLHGAVLGTLKREAA